MFRQNITSGRRERYPLLIILHTSLFIRAYTKHHLDNAYLNVSAYHAHGTSNHYALGRKSIIKLILHQLAENPGNRCESLGKQGTYSTLFTLTLESYGYTFITKGTVTAFTAKLKHEGLVYWHLDEVQGELIPVVNRLAVSLLWEERERKSRKDVKPKAENRRCCCILSLCYYTGKEVSVWVALATEETKPK